MPVRRAPLLGEPTGRPLCHFYQHARPIRSGDRPVTPVRRPGSPSSSALVFALLVFVAVLDAAVLPTFALLASPAQPAATRTAEMANVTMTGRKNCIAQ